MTLVKFNPTDTNKNGLIKGYSDVFDSIFNNTFFSDRIMTPVPAVNISESPDHYHLELAAPGLKKEDFKLNMERNILSISVEQAQQSRDRNYNMREFSYSSFVRSFTLPESADENDIEARYTDGVLSIDIAKREEAKTQTRKIEIK